MDTNSRIYIAGHNGMVGSAIKRKLEEHGYKNLIYCSSDELDLTEQESVRKFFEKKKPEYVFLAAAKVGGIMANNTFRAQFIYENLMIQNNIIHQSFKTGVKKLLFLGSSCIYPRLAPQPLKEEYLLTSELEYTNEPYAIAKIAGIKMIESYNIQYGTDFLSVMPTNLYGPNDSYDLQKSHVLPAMIRKIHLAKCVENGDWNSIRKDLQKRPIENINGTASEDLIIELLGKYGIVMNDFHKELHSLNPKSLIRNPKSVFVKLWGSGSPYREFMHVDDMAAACLHIMEKVSFRDLIQIQGKTDDSLHAAVVPSSSVRGPQSSVPNQPSAVSDPPSSVSGLPSSVSGLPSSVNSPQSSVPGPLSSISGPPSAVTSQPSAVILNTHINLGTGVDLTIRELAEMIKNIIGFKGTIEWDPSKPDGTPRKLMDVTKMRALGFEPKISLINGIERTYTDYLENL
jgi:GDP-L-fucose synthase